jgi:hypothetical protein
MLICGELHKWSEPMQGVRRHMRERLNIPLQLQVVGREHRVRLSLLPHVSRVLERGELFS